jgi:protein TonB
MDYRFAVFLTASLLAHASVVLWKVEKPPLLAIGGQAQALQVTVVANQSLARSEPAAASEETRQLSGSPPDHGTPLTQQPAMRVATSAKVPAPDQKPPSRHARSSAPEQKQRAPGSTQASRQPSSMQVSEQISTALRHQLAKHFKYPWLARKRGWQGKVTLSLRVDRNGKLTQWAVSKTSGYALLDRSALNTAKAIGSLPQAAAWLNGRSLNLLIPVRYQLLDS